MLTLTPPHTHACSQFYDETQFFSSELLFARFEDKSLVDTHLFPAFKRYLTTHLDLLSSSPALGAAEEANVLDYQRDYDVYSAERDPATGMFAGMFGKEWAEEFVHGHLFSLSR